MAKNFGSIDFGKFKEHITNQIMNTVNNLSEEEKEALISGLEQNNDADNADIWCAHINPMGKYILSGYRGNDVNVVLPDTIDGKFYEISGVVFRSSSIETITVSTGVTSIDRLAFAHCDKLKKVIFADGFNGTIMSSAFMECNSLEEFTFPLNTIVVEPIVARCQRLETVYLPNSVSEIGAYAFAEDENLKNIYFNGYKSQWKAIEKGFRWSYGMGNYTIYCLDGKISVRKKEKRNVAHTEEKEIIEYIYCDVKFENNPRKFSYITDDTSIAVDDSVVVPTGPNNLESIAIVCNIKRCTSENAPYPPSKTKKIIKKC